MKKVVLHRKDIYYTYDVDSGLFSEDNTLPIMNKTDIAITCNQIFPTKARIYDIYAIERAIYYPGPKNIYRLNEKYLHKTLVIDEKKIKNILKTIYSIYQKQIKELKEIELLDYIDFEASIAGSIAYINTGKIILKKEFLDEYERKRSNYRNNDILTRSEIIQISNENRYNLYDTRNGKWDFTHDKLIKTGDRKLIKHVESSKIKSELLHLKQFYEEELKINHVSFGAKTGRISTSKPNIQGMNKEWIDGNIYSFDFTAYELIIYLSLHNKTLLDDYVYSGAKDFYSFLFCKTAKLKRDPDSFGEKYPEKRNLFKRMCIAVLYGATKSDIDYLMGKDVSKMYDDLTFVLNIEPVKKNLVDFVKNTGRFLIHRDLSFTIADKYSHNFNAVAKTAVELKKKYGKELNKEYWSDNKEIYLSRNGFHDKLIYEKGILQEAINCYEQVNKYCINYHIQGIGAYIIKSCIKKILSSVKSKILILRHDECIIDILDENDIPIIENIMKNVFKNIMGADIEIKVKKI